MQCQGLEDIGIIYNKIPPDLIFEIKNYVTKRLPELLPSVTLLGFMCKNPDSSSFAYGFDTFIDRKRLLFEWLKITIPL
jgi:hypothetical protein